MTVISCSHERHQFTKNGRLWSPGKSRRSPRRRSSSSNSPSSALRRGASPCKQVSDSGMREVFQPPDLPYTTGEHSSRLADDVNSKDAKEIQIQAAGVANATHRLDNARIELQCSKIGNIKPPQSPPNACGVQGTHPARNARLRRPSTATTVRMSTSISGGENPEDWLEERKRYPAQTALFALMRVVAASENHLEEIRSRLMLCSAFNAEKAFHDLHADPNTPKSDPVSAKDLTLWLAKANYPVQVQGSDVEALFMRYSGSKELDMAGFLRIVTRRSSAQEKGETGNTRRGSGMLQMHSGNAFRAAAAQVSIRLAQVFERELQLIREVLVRQKELLKLNLFPSDSIMLLGGSSGGGFSLQELRKRFTALGSGPLSLSFEEQTAVVRHLAPDNDTVSKEDWDKFMNLGKQFTPNRSLMAKFYTKECQVCSTRVLRPYVSCPDCGQKIHGPTSEF
eukprot:gnl/MRDRNA2_/MRDRNA2_97108_c0_seq1.p1 gnl/MRDRNA2_/MRDRNA2_97108_c0~~gnl/MRDRNA2_/MRDRNA2_97108_c0_seq1.p1  ORF type:complete len:453 (+),score=81.22 gnl/MRDRNA2_/MRDRNA2_97108_c0_seq1:100-1458(+)